MKIKKEERQQLLIETIEKTPFITDEKLAKMFDVSIQTIRLDRLEHSIPELRKRIKSVAKESWNGLVKSLPLDEVIGDIVDLQLDERAISILTIKREYVFSRNKIARGHHIFAQANSLAVAIMNDELALTKESKINFIRQVKLGEQVVAKASVKSTDHQGLSVVNVESFVNNELVFTGVFHMFRSKTSEIKGEVKDENSH